MIGASELVRQALAATRAGDEDGRWDRIVDLHRADGAEVLDEARRLCASHDPARRRLGADILGQLRGATAADGTPRIGEPLHEAAMGILLDLAAVEGDPDVLRALGTAFGHRHDPRCVPALRRWRVHPDPDVRYAVTFGLIGLTDPLAIDTLIELSRDDDDHVRNWATFGLARQVNTDTPAVRDALLARTADPDDDARAEGLIGMALRRDDRVVPMLLDALNRPVWYGSAPDLVHDAMHRMAHLTGDPRLWYHVRHHPVWFRHASRGRA
jgi:HEAT repeat protein